MCVIGPGATLKGRPWPFAPTCAVGPLWLAYCASYAGSTPAGTTPGPIDGLWETRTGIISPIRCDTRGALSVVRAPRRTSTFDQAGKPVVESFDDLSRWRRKPTKESRGWSVVARAARPPGVPDLAMGVGEEALGAHLAAEGWSLKPGVLAHFGEREDLASARRALLDADLRRVGEPVARAGNAHLAGPVVLQVMAVTDISRPSRGAWDPAATASAFGKGRASDAKGDARGSSAPTRMLRVELTDGDRALVGVEHETLHAIADEDAIPPGSKVLVPPGVVLREVDGLLLLRGDESLVLLGGRVAPLVRDWERARARRARADAAAAARDAPTYRPYDPHALDAVEAAAEEKRAEAERVADEAAARAAASAAAAAAAAADADRRELADARTEFVPRRRPALPPTRAQRAAAAASGEPLLKPGAPIPASVPTTEGRKASGANEKETKPDVAARARPALPPRRAPPAPPAALAPPDPPDADARRRERLLARFLEPSRATLRSHGAEGRGGGGGRRDERGGRRDERGGRGGGRGGRGGGRGGRGRGGDDDDDDDGDEGLVTFEQHVARRGRGDDDASEALARRLHRELNVGAATDASSDLAASLFAFSRPVADNGARGARGARGRR